MRLVWVLPPAPDEGDAVDDASHCEDDQGQGGHDDVEHFKVYIQRGTENTAARSIQKIILEYFTETNN